MNSKPLSILLVEGNPADSQALERYVREQNLPYKIQIAGTLDKAILLLNQSSYDLVLLDYPLPGAKGPELLSVIGHMPAVILAGKGAEKATAQAMRLVTCEYLAKDPDQNHLALLPSVVENAIRRRQTKIDLADSENRYKIIVETVSDIIFQLDPEKKIVFINSAIRQLGYAPAEMIGRPIEDYVCVDDRNTLLQIATKRVGDRATRDLEVRFKRRGEGSLLWHEIKTASMAIHSIGIWSGNVRSAKYGENEFLGTQCVARDISERKKIEASLRESEKKLHSMFGHAMDGIIVIHDDGIVESFNPAAERIFGYKAEEMIGKNINLLMSDPYRNEHDGYIRNYLRTGQAKILGYAREVSAVRKNGETFPLEISVSEIKPAGGVPGGRSMFIGIVRDITKRKQTEETLKKNAAYMQLLKEVAVAANDARNVESAMQAAIDHVCRIIGWPVGHLYLLTRTPENVLVPTDLWHIEDPEKFRGFKEATDKTTFSAGIGLPGRVLSGGKPEWIQDVTADPNFPRIKRNDDEPDRQDAAGGHWKDVGIRAGFAFPALCGKEVVAILEFFSPEAIARDDHLLEVMVHMGAQLGRVVERKRAEEELRLYRESLEELVQLRTQELKTTHDQLLYSEKLAATGKLAASIAHEFNNPVYGIRNVLEQIGEDLSMDETHKTLVGLAVKECNRIAELIKKLRDFYEPSSGLMAIVDIHQLLDDLATLFKIRFMEKKIVLGKKYAPVMPKIKAVGDQIKQAFLNLLQNAEEAIPPSGGKIFLVTENLGDRVKIHIQDTGVGIAPEIMKSIFDPFFTTKSAIKVTGLGLSVAYGIVKTHGGNIEVSSALGKGATFTVILPVK